jgi:hypothetical protein
MWCVAGSRRGGWCGCALSGGGNGVGNGIEAEGWFADHVAQRVEVGAHDGAGAGVAVVPFERLARR